MTSFLITVTVGWMIAGVIFALLLLLHRLLRNPTFRYVVAGTVLLLCASGAFYFVGSAALKLMGFG